MKIIIKSTIRNGSPWAEWASCRRWRPWLRAAGGVGAAATSRPSKWSEGPRTWCPRGPRRPPSRLPPPSCRQDTNGDQVHAGVPLQRQSWFPILGNRVYTFPERAHISDVLGTMRSLRHPPHSLLMHNFWIACDCSIHPRVRRRVVKFYSVRLDCIVGRLSGFRQFCAVTSNCRPPIYFQSFAPIFPRWSNFICSEWVSWLPYINRIIKDSPW